MTNFDAAMVTANELQNILEVAIPSIVFFLTVLVGMDITTDHLLNLKKCKKAFAVGTMGQYFLPIGSLVVLKLLKPDPEISAGLILIASAPGGGISNYYTYLARGNVALSVLLTAISCLLASVTMPVLLAVFTKVLDRQLDFAVPVLLLFKQLMFLLILPVISGFIIRKFWPQFVERFNKRLRIIGFSALAALIVFIIYQTRLLVLQKWPYITLVAVCFVLISMSYGYFLALFLKLNNKDSLTVVIELGVRNIAIPTAIAVVFLAKTEFATFGAIFFLVELVLIMGFIGLSNAIERRADISR